MLKLPTFKTKEEIPAAFLPMYEEKDGEWVGKEEEDESSGLKTALQKERDRAAEQERLRKEAEGKLKELERDKKGTEAGMTSDEVKKFREDTYREIRAEVDEEVAELKKSVETANGKVRELKLDSNVKALALKHGVAPDKVDDWWALNSSHFDLGDNDTPIVKDGKGKDVTKYISEDLKKARPYLYEGTKAAGGGGGSNDRGRNTGLPSGGAPSGEDILKNPGQALRAAREAGDTATNGANGTL